jgi:hypothetical protein
MAAAAADHAAGAAAAAAAPVTPENVGYLFVKQYYTTLHSKPGTLHRFYKKQSVYTHGEERENVTPVMGQQVQAPRVVREVGRACNMAWLTQGGGRTVRHS